VAFYRKNGFDDLKKAVHETVPQQRMKPPHYPNEMICAPPREKTKVFQGKAVARPGDKQ
jgi:hypothetical protein